MIDNPMFIKSSEGWVKPSEQQRAKFEAWAKNEDYDLEKAEDDYDYWYKKTNEAWKIWQVIDALDAQNQPKVSDKKVCCSKECDNEFLLPYDIDIEELRFCKGVKLGILIDAFRRCRKNQQARGKTHDKL